MSKIWLTSDCHFNHINCLELDGRPFDTIEEMNQILIDNWNSVVAPEDTIYVLGDFIMGRSNKKDIEKIVNSLNGTIVLVRGNHDTDAKWKIYEELGIELKDLAYIKEGKKYFICSHYPMLVGNYNDKKKVVNLHGHAHQLRSMSIYLPKCYNVNVCAHNYTPISLDDIINEINSTIGFDWDIDKVTAEELKRQMGDLNENRS